MADIETQNNGNGANYNDVLEVAISDKQFKKGLEGLFSAYKDFLNKLKADGADPSQVFGVGSASSIASSLKEFTDTVRQIKKDVREVFNLGDESLNNTSKSAEKAKGDLKAVGDQAEATSKQVSEAEKRIADARRINKALTEEGAVSKAEQIGGIPGTDIKASYDGRVKAAQDAAESLRVINDQELKDFSKTISDELEIFLGAEDKKRKAASESADLISKYGTADGRRQAVQERRSLNDQELRDFSKMIADELDIAIGAQNKRTQAEKEGADLRKAQRRKDLEEDQKRFDAEALAERRATQAKEAGYKTINSELAKANRLQQEQIELLNRQGNGWRGFLNGITQNFARSLGQMVRFTLGFKILFGLLNQAGNVFQFIFVDSFKIGFDYLTKMQNRSADIRETLVNTVKFSGDWAENVKKAGVAAEFVTEQIKQWSFKTALDPEKIEAGFKGLAQAGGLQALKNDLGDAVEFSAKLLSAYRGLGTSANNQRVFVQNINNLFSAQVTSGNQLLKVLHLSADEWTKIRDNAVATGKSVLFDARVQQALRGTVERVKDLNERWEDVIASLKSYGSELLGTFAAPLFKTVLQYLDQIKKYYEDHREEILKVAGILGLTVEELAKSLAVLTETTDILPLAAKGFGLMALSASTIADHLANAYHQLKLMAQEPTDNQDELDRREYEEEKYQKQFKQRIEERKKLWSSILNLEGKSGKKAPFGFDITQVNSADSIAKRYSQIIENLVHVGDTGKKEESDRKLLHDKISAMRSELQGFEADVERIGDEYRNSIQQKIDESTISLKEGSQQIKDRYLADFEAIAAAVDITIDSLRKLGNDPAVKKAVQDLENQKIKLKNKLDNEKSAEDHKVTLEDNRQKLADFKASLDAQLDAKKKAVAEEEALNQQGYVSAKALTQKRIELAEQEHKNQIDIINQELVGKDPESSFYKERVREREDLDREWAATRITLQQQVYDAEQQEIQRSIDLRNTQIQQDLETERAKLDQQINLGTFRNQQEEIQARLVLAEREFSVAQQIASSLRQQYNNAVLLKKEKQEIADLDAKARAAEQAAQAKGRDLINQRLQNNPIYQIFGGSSVTHDVNGEATGASLNEAFKNTTNTIQSLGNAAKFASGNLQNIGGLISQGMQQGGVLGAIGGGLQGVGGALSSIGGAASGIGKMFGATAGKVAGALGPIGAIAGAVGSLIGPIASLFTRAARRIGQEMANKINDTLEKYTQGQLSMFDTIGELQRERNEAISRLAGKKGGQQQLDQLLPSLDKQINSLIKQQKEIRNRFEENLLVLRANDDVSQKWLKDWIDINKTVKEYIDAVGQAAGSQNATDFLNLQLSAKRKELQDQLNDAEKEAISDILNYNDLLKQQTALADQRNQLEEDFARTKFEILGADSLERRVSNAVKAGQDLAAAQKEHDQQLAALNDEEAALKSQIDLATQKVALERDLFNLTTDTTALRQRSNELELLSLDALRDKVNTLKDLLAKTANLVADSGVLPGTSQGTIGVIPGYGNTSTVNVSAINVYGADDPAQTANVIAREINKLSRYGYSTGIG